jgi:hypothetical protein
MSKCQWVQKECREFRRGTKETVPINNILVPRYYLRERQIIYWYP